MRPQALNYETCEDYMAGSSTADEKCGWSERYQVYLKKNVYWPDIPDYIDYSFNLAKQSVPHQLMGYNEYKMESAVGCVATTIRFQVGGLPNQPTNQPNRILYSLSVQGGRRPSPTKSTSS